MTEHSTGIRIRSASVTDRGLNERRPLNEDSMLIDPEHNIYSVADGVGGAEAGEVASQTAIEVLGEAFRQHARGEDAEDLMEIAIQRANDSIYRMSREHQKFSMMATTIVALHVDGWRATIGHVGDSRIYSLTPEGTLRRETDDHSVVEEEVRAGRMTAQQAANHPSRNVISRALGAEASVEVDLKTVEVEDGTTFLLCSDGITRHIPDDELASVLGAAPDLEAACAEMKRLCFERGAEDNLTAVLVRVGDAGRGHSGARAPEEDDDVTLVHERVPASRATTLSDETAIPVLRRPFDDAGAGATQTAAAAGSSAVGESAGASSARNESSKHDAAGARGGGAGRVLGVLVLVLAAAAAAFYAGMFFQRRGAGPSPAAPAVSAVSATPAIESPAERFEKMRREVDLKPADEAARMSADANGQSPNSQDPEFLYLYGRALLLTGKYEDAASAFERAAQKAAEHQTPRNGQLKIDARLATIAARLRAEDFNGARESARALDEFMRLDSRAPTEATPTAQGNMGAAPTVSP